MRELVIAFSGREPCYRHDGFLEAIWLAEVNDAGLFGEDAISAVAGISDEHLWELTKAAMRWLKALERDREIP